MANNEVGQAVELTNRIMDIIEGESPEVLNEIVHLLNYHMGYRAGANNGLYSVRRIVQMANKES